MVVNLTDLKNKFPKLQVSPFADEVKFKSTHGTDSITVIVTSQGDVLVYACCIISPLSVPRILVDRQYFNQQELESDLEIFLKPLQE